MTGELPNVPRRVETNGLHYVRADIVGNLMNAVRGLCDATTDAERTAARDLGEWALDNASWKEAARTL